jgi:membrane associated rhomboid family serine protease
MWLIILILNIIVFFVQFSNGENSPQARAFAEYGALSLGGLKKGFVWQLLTFQFLHGGLPHLVLNSIVLYSFGRPLEEFLGKRSFLSLYLLSGFAGGITQVLLGFVSDRFTGPMVGASAGICGLVAAFALLSPQSTIYLAFVIPIRAIYFLPLVIAVTVMLMLIPSNDHIAHAAHLGGILAGIAWVRVGWRDYAALPWVGLFERWRRWRPLQSRQRKRELVRAASLRAKPWLQPPAESPLDLPADEFISREVDPILDKISQHGIQSLTERERKILEAARKKMAKR